MQNRLEPRVGEDANAALCSRHEDLLSAPAEGNLIRLRFLLMRTQWCGLSRREDENVVRLQ